MAEIRSCGCFDALVRRNALFLFVSGQIDEIWLEAGLPACAHDGRAEILAGRGKNGLLVG